MNKNRIPFPELEDKMSFSSWLIFNLAYPLEWSRQTVAEYGFKYWEDELSDLMSTLQAVFRFVFSPFFMSMTSIFVCWMLIGNANLISLTTYFSKAPFLIDSVDQPEQQSLALNQSNVEYLIAKYRELEAAHPESNLELLNNLGTRLGLAQQMVAEPVIEQQGGEYLLSSSIDFAIECLSGDLPIPQVVIQGLTFRPTQTPANQNQRLQQLIALSDVVHKIVVKTSDPQAWRDIEQLFESLASAGNFDEKERKTVFKLAKISKTSSYFAQPNRLAEIFDQQR